MPLEVFIYLGDNTPRRSLPEPQRDLTAAGFPCRIEESKYGPWLVLDGHEMDMSITLDPDGTATSAMIQWPAVGPDSPEVLDSLLAAFERLGWVVYPEYL